MSENGATNEDAKDWPEKNENAFLQILSERLKKNPNGAPISKPSDWKDIDEELMLETGQQYGIPRIKGKYNRLRIKHRLFSELLEHTGVTYDTNSNTVFATDDVWQMFYKKHKIYKSFRKNGCKNYEMLCQIFDKSTSAKRLHRASTQLPPTSDDECQNEEEFLNDGVHVINEEKSKGKRTADDFGLELCIRVKKDSTLEKLDSCLEMWAASLNARKERDLAKAEMYRAQCDQGKDAEVDPYSINKCMDALEVVENVSNTSYNKALEKFKDADWRRMFIRMPPERKKNWLKSL